MTSVSLTCNTGNYLCISVHEQPIIYSRFLTLVTRKVHSFSPIKTTAVSSLQGLRGIWDVVRTIFADFSMNPPESLHIFSTAGDLALLQLGPLAIYNNPGRGEGGGGGLMFVGRVLRRGKIGITSASFLLLHVRLSFSHDRSRGG